MIVGGTAPASPHHAYGFWRLLAREWRRLFSRPWLELSVVAGNAAVVLVGWYLLPRSWRDFVFDDVHGPAALALVLQSWLLADVTSTNLLGHDEPAALWSLRSPDSARAMARLLRIKCLAIGSVISVVTLAAAVVTAADRPRALRRAWLFLPGLMLLPAGMVALTCVVGVAWPYRQRTLRWRWRHRVRRWMTLRWLGLLVSPYLVLGSLATATMFVAREVADLLTGYDGRGRPPATTLTTLGAVIAVASLAAWWGLPMLWGRLAARRAEHLRTYLEDPLAG